MPLHCMYVGGVCNSMLPTAVLPTACVYHLISLRTGIQSSSRLAILRPMMGVHFAGACRTRACPARLAGEPVYGGVVCMGCCAMLPTSTNTSYQLKQKACYLSNKIDDHSGKYCTTICKRLATRQKERWVRLINGVSSVNTSTRARLSIPAYTSPNSIQYPVAANMISGVGNAGFNVRAV